MPKKQKQFNLIIVCGLVGAGKTTVANCLATKIPAVLFSTDKDQKYLMPKKKYQVFGSKRINSYTREEKDVVYQAMFLAASHLLEFTNVIIDGTFDLNRYFSGAKRIAKPQKAKVKVIECVLSDPEIVQQRVEKRFQSKKGDSTANYHIYKLAKARYQKKNFPHFVLDTSGNWRKELSAWVKNSIK